MLSFKHYDYTHSFPYFQFHFIFSFFFLLTLAQTNKSPAFPGRTFDGCFSSTLR